MSHFFCGMRLIEPFFLVLFLLPDFLKMTHSKKTFQCVWQSLEASRK